MSKAKDGKTKTDLDHPTMSVEFVCGIKIVQALFAERHRCCKALGVLIAKHSAYGVSAFSKKPGPDTIKGIRFAVKHLGSNALPTPHVENLVEAIEAGTYTQKKEVGNDGSNGSETVPQTRVGD